MEFRSWGKTPRLYRDIVITEKVDGTNAAVIFEELAEGEARHPESLAVITRDGINYQVGAQSKNRLITPGKATDNYNFAQWVRENRELLFDRLGPGHHFGEWAGKGIQGRYGDIDYRVFSLFNTARHKETFFYTEPINGTRVMVESVPVLYEGTFSGEAVQGAIKILREFGSAFEPFHRNPEGIVIYHTQSKQSYKVTFDNNDKGKWESI